MGDLTRAANHLTQQPRKSENERSERSKTTTKMANNIYSINTAKKSGRDCGMCRCLKEPCRVR